MTVTSQTNRVAFQGNGATTVFPFTFVIPTENDLVVTLVSLVDGSEMVLSSTQYSVTGIGDVAGGEVTYPLSGSPIDSTYSLVIEREVPYTQAVDLTNQDGFYPDVLESGLDQIVYQVQQLADQLGRSLQVSIADSAPGTIPNASARANMVLGFDANGNPTAVAGLDGAVPVSVFMQSILLAANLAAAQAALGITSEPAGVMKAYGGAAAPTGYLLCDGASKLRADYPDLFTAIGTTYGAADGTHFNVPDLRGRVAIGKDGGAGRVTATTFTPDGNTLGAVGGEQTHAMIAAENGVHNHTASSVVTDPGHHHSVTPIPGVWNGGYGAAGSAPNQPQASVNSGNATTGITVATSVNNDGSGTPHNNMPPGLIVNWIIKT